MADNAPLTTNRLGLTDETKKFVSRLLQSELMDLPSLKKVVGSLLAQKRPLDPKSIIKAAIGAGILTNWQGRQLLAGHHEGFFLGSYKLLKPLGAGGMGVVYLAEHKVMERRIALKILPVAAMQDKTRVARFRAEAKAAAKLDHPNIVQAYDFGEAGGKAFIVMEFVDGMDLHHVVARDGQMTYRAAVEALLQAADGLGHAHSRGIVHRDIKPSNLMLRQDGVLKISDMGLARIGYQSDGNLTTDGSGVMGTSDFLAPEQALDSHSVDGRADIYGLGCTLFYLLTKQPPYPSTNLAERIAKHQTAPPADIRELRPDCPPALAALAMRMMAKRPADRIATCGDLQAALRRLVAQGNLGSDAGLTTLLSAGDTATDDLSLQVTSSGGSSHTPSGPLVTASNPLDTFDFGSLPSAPTNAPSSHAPSSHGPGPLGAATVNMPAAPAYVAPTSSFAAPPVGVSVPGKPAGTTASTRSANQSLLLGVGLTLAVLAAVVTSSITIIGMTREEPKKTPNFKVTEDREGKGIIIVGP